jgi:hypothetical protein
MPRQLIAVSMMLTGLASNAYSQPIRLTESFAKDAQYHVRCEVEITGTLSVQGKAKPLNVVGKSSIQYDERILQISANHRVERTVRYYRQLAFERKVGDEEQRNKLRPEAHRLVILRHNHIEVPFCPTTPLTWGEIELVRTDVFAPALRGLFPSGPVSPGDSWRADDIAMRELTDLEKIEKADLTCRFEKVTTLLGRRNAHVQFEGKVQGLGEDGHALHELRGSYYIDLDADFMSYLYVKGTHHLLDKTGKATGKIDGSFMMTRSPGAQSKEISDDALRGMTLEPNAENSLLLFEHPQTGARFLYPRNWHVAGVNDKQIGVDEKRGCGVLITLTPAASTPNGTQFFNETVSFLQKERAKLTRAEKPRVVQSGLETFSFEGELANQKVVLQYYTTRQGDHGATLTARILPAHAAEVQGDVERIARSLQWRTK